MNVGGTVDGSLNKKSWKKRTFTFCLLAFTLARKSTSPATAASLH